MPDFTSPKETGGAGGHFENLTAAYLVSCLLSDKHFDAQFEPPARIDFQNNGRGWQDIDDLLITEQIKSGNKKAHRIAISVKSNQQIKANKFPLDFVATAWSLHLADDSPFDPTNDNLALVSPSLVDNTRLEWQGLSEWSRKKDNNELKEALYREGEANEKMRTLYESFACPELSQYSNLASEVEQAKLLSRIIVYSWDLNNSSGEQAIQGIEHCKSVLENQGDAELLWEKLIVLAQQYNQVSGTLTQAKLFLELSKSFKLKSPELILAKQEYDLYYSLKESESRCLRSWELLGLTEVEANTLLEDETVGVGVPEYLPTDEYPFRLITAPLGHGKTLFAEKVFQHSIKSKIDTPNSILPSLWKAERVYDSILEKTRELIELNKNTEKAYLIIIDNLDEIDSHLARKLILDCKNAIQIHRSFKLHFLVLSRPLAFFKDDAIKSIVNEIELLPLTEEEIDSLFEKIVGREQHWRYDEKSIAVQEAIQSPLFTILGAIFVRDNNLWGSPSPTKLIHYWVEKKLAVLDSRFNHSRKDLTILAYFVLNSSTSEVDRALLEGKISIEGIINSRLIRSSGSKFTFALRILAEWFGAQFIHSEILNSRPLNLKVEQLDKWLPSFRLFVQTASHDGIKSLFEYLLLLSPSFCFRAFEGLENVDRIEDESVKTTYSKYEMAKYMRESMLAWLGAYGNELSTLIGPVNSDGKLNPLGISSRPLIGSIGGHEIHSGAYAWCYKNPSYFATEIFDLEEVLKSIHRDDWWNYFKIIHSVVLTTTPVQIWSNVRQELSKELEHRIQKRQLITNVEAAKDELIWGSALSVCNFNPQTTDSVSVNQVLAAINSYGDLEIAHKYHWPINLKLLRTKLLTLKDSGIETISSPYGILRKSKDRKQEFSQGEVDVLLNRSKRIFETAFSIYKIMVENYFPTLMNRMNIYQLLPVKMLGKISGSNSWSGPSIQINYTILPNNINEMTAVELTFSDKWNWYDEEQREIAEKTAENLMQLRPNTYEWIHMPLTHGPLDIFGHFPSFDWAYKMLSWDLIELGVTKEKYRTESDENSRIIGSARYDN